MTTTSSLDPQQTADFAATFAGRVLRPEDNGYDAARRVHNGMIDKRPALIAQSVGLADIVEAVNFGREHDLEISVRGGGHNVAGSAVSDGGLMVDLSSMKGLHVDPGSRTCRAQAGLTWAEFNRETQLYGLATTGGVVSTTGIAGLTLGGGLGWLMGTHGLTVDNLLSVDLVTATGDIVRASETENPDLFWGVRGGGGNFGVVGSFEYRLHPLDGVVGGIIAFPFDAARDVLRFYRDFTATLPDDLTVFCGLLHAPDGSGTPIVALILCHAGQAVQAEEDLRPVKEFGTPIMDALGPITYNEMNTLLDDGFPKGALNYWKSSFLESLPDEAIDTMIAKFASCPSAMSGILLEHFHGAATRVATGATAFPHRDVGHNLLLVGEWTDPDATDTNIAWTRDAYAAMEPFMKSGRYVNYIAWDEAEDPAPAAYGSNYQRLLQLKNQWDPANLFHMNQNIRPSV